VPSSSRPIRRPGRDDSPRSIWKPIATWKPNARSPR
jgi:hypothetical protein